MKLMHWIKDNDIVKEEKALETIKKSETRIIKAYKEMLEGYNIDPNKILNTVEYVKEYQGLVIEKKIKYTSICGHHFLPFYGEIDIIYEPNEIITGLGKLPRLAQVFAKRFQLQEFLVREIAEMLMTKINAKGVYVRATGTHLCMCARGPNDNNVQTITTYALGTLNNSERKNEVILLLQ